MATASLQDIGDRENDVQKLTRENELLRGKVERLTLKLGVAEVKLSLPQKLSCPSRSDNLEAGMKRKPSSPAYDSSSPMYDASSPAYNTKRRCFNVQ